MHAYTTHRVFPTNRSQLCVTRKARRRRRLVSPAFLLRPPPCEGCPCRPPLCGPAVGASSVPRKATSEHGQLRKGPAKEQRACSWLLDKSSDSMILVTASLRRSGTCCRVRSPSVKPTFSGDDCVGGSLLPALTGLAPDSAVFAVEDGAVPGWGAVGALPAASALVESLTTEAKEALSAFAEGAS